MVQSPPTAPGPGASLPAAGATVRLPHAMVAPYLKPWEGNLDAELSLPPEFHGARGRRCGDRGRRPGAGAANQRDHQVAADVEFSQESRYAVWRGGDHRPHRRRDDGR